MYSILENGQFNTIEIPDVLMGRLNGALKIDGDYNRVTIMPFRHLPQAPNKNVVNITVRGDHNDIRIENIGSVNRLTILMAGSCKIRIGERTTFNNDVEILLHEPSSVTIGEDCMIGGGVRFHTSDMHPMFDLDSGNRINAALPIVIEDHVWIGANAVITKGVQVRAGSIVGQRSLVTGNIPAYVCCAGVPARVIRERVTWGRNLHEDLDRSLLPLSVIR